MFLGDISGCIGETSKLALLLGGIWLLWKGIIKPQIPLAYLGTVAALSLLFSQGQPPVLWMAYQLLSGSLILGLSILSCIMTEAFATKKVRLNGAETLTGLLLGLSLPASVSWWIPVVGGVFSVLVVKHLCGGLGKNVFNPVLVSRAFLLLFWPSQLTLFPERELD